MLRQLSFRRFSSLCIVAVALDHSALAGLIDVDTLVGPGVQLSDVTVVDGVSPPTRLTVIDGGRVEGASVAIDARDSSIVEIQGGSIVGGVGVRLNDESLLRMTGGDIDAFGIGIESRGASRVILDSGSWNSVDAYDSSRVRVNGGNNSSVFEVQTYGESHAVLNSERFNFTADESSTAVINSGNYESASARGNSEVLINGGFYLTGLVAFDEAIVRIRDIHSIDEEYVDVRNNATAHVYGTNLRFDVSPEIGPIVRGTWADGDNFAFKYRLRDQGQIILHEVPEPGSWGLLGVGVVAGLALRWRIRVQ